MSAGAVRGLALGSGFGGAVRPVLSLLQALDLPRVGGERGQGADDMPAARVHAVGAIARRPHFRIACDAQHIKRGEDFAEPYGPGISHGGRGA